MAEPATLYDTIVQADWVDYNGHMRDGYYVVVFSSGVDALMDHLGIDAGYREATACTLYSVEIHVTFLKEVRAHEPLSADVQILGADAKRLHIFQRLLHGRTGDLLATQESIQLHVDQSAGPAAAPFREPAAARVQRLWEEHQELERPRLAGRAIAMSRPKD